MIDSVRERVAAAIGGGSPLVLAVSGGRDSVVLLDAVRAVAPGQVLAVATYDHGTGPVARRAADHVVELAARAGLPCVRGHASTALTTNEAAWRAARWQFLRRAARQGARAAGVDDVEVATGHTEDDQLETVLMRLLRGAGARGLAGMAAPMPGVVRPLLRVSAGEVATYAARRGLRWVDDVTNASHAHLRNRVRHALLPALLGARPELRAQLLALGRDAAAWREETESAADSLIAARAARDVGDLVVPLARLAGYDSGALAVLWPALAARNGVRLDRRATARLVAFTAGGAARQAAGQVPTGRIQLAGPSTVSLERHGRSPDRAMVLRRGLDDGSTSEPIGPVDVSVDALAAGLCVGRWRFSLGVAPAGDDPWSVGLPGGFRYVVREWRPGDRMRVRLGGPARRVKRYFADRHVPAAERAGWPVVVALDSDASPEAPGDIVWIPGVRRTDAAPARPGQPGFVLVCTRPQPTP